MDPMAGLAVGLILVLVLVVAMPRLRGGTSVVCTRCRGSGQVEEHWPDANEPSGFHNLSGRCPKCGGKGRTRA